METETIYSLNKKDVRSVCAFMLIKIMISSMSKEENGPNLDKLTEEIGEFIQRLGK